MSQEAESHPHDQSDEEIVVFISHSSRNAAIAAGFVRCLKDCIGFGEQQIRCSSVHGHTIAPGANAETVVRNDLHSCSVVLGLLSSASRKSEWVAMELGAAWILRKSPIFVRLPGSSVRQVPEPFRALQTVGTNEQEIAKLMVQVGKQTSRRADITSDKAKTVIREFVRIARIPRRRRRWMAAIVFLAVVFLAVVAFLLAAGVIRYRRPVPTIVKQFENQSFPPISDGFTVSCDAEDNALRVEVRGISHRLGSFGGCCIEGDASVNIAQYDKLRVELLARHAARQLEVKLEAGPFGKSTPTFLHRGPFDDVGGRDYRIIDYPIEPQTTTIDRVCFAFVDSSGEYKNTIRVKSANLIPRAPAPESKDATGLAGQIAR